MRSSIPFLIAHRLASFKSCQKILGPLWSKMTQISWFLLASELDSGYASIIENSILQQKISLFFTFHQSNAWTSSRTWVLLFFDGYSGYNQISVAPDDQEKTTFTCIFDLLIAVCPLGCAMFCNVSTLHDHFSNMVKSSLKFFINNFSIFGDTFSECLYHLKLVLVWCKEKNLTLNWCRFMVKHRIIL